MSWGGPERTGTPFPSLGWALLEWWHETFASPRDPSAPLTFTDEQAMVLLRWYEVHPLTGVFLWRRGCSRRSKGSGKSPVEACKDIAELAGPVVFDGWDANGNATGRPWGTGGLPEPWVQVAAVSEDQTDNTWSVAYGLLTDNDGRAADELRIDAGLTRLFLRDRKGRAEPVTAAAGSREGQPVTYASLDETHLWTPRNGGRRLAATLRRNVAKMGGRSYETTNAYVPGEDSVAEATDRAVAKGVGIFSDAVEAPTHVEGIEVTEDAPDWVLRRALETPYAGCWWNDLDRLVAEARDPDVDWDDFCRFHLNWPRKGARRAIDPKVWAERAVTNQTVPDGARIGLGFDGSVSDDATALIGCTATGHLFVVSVWERPAGEKDWRVPRLKVHEAVRDAMARWSVGRMLCDPAKWRTEIEGWIEEWNEGLKLEEAVVVLFDTNRSTLMAPACDRFSTGLAEKTLTHSDHPVLTRHVLAMDRVKVSARAADDDGRTRYVFTKGEGDRARKIDAGIGAVLAFEAAMTMPEKAPEEPAELVSF